MPKQTDSEYRQAHNEYLKKIAALNNDWEKKQGELVKRVISGFEAQFNSAMVLLDDVPAEHDREVLKIKSVKGFLRRFAVNGKIGARAIKSEGAGASTKGVTDEKILELLGTGEKSGKELQEAFGWTTSASVGQRMKPLIKAGKVTPRQGEGTGRPKFYSLKK